MIINDPTFNKKYTSEQQDGEIYIHQKKCDYWKITERMGYYRLVAWNRNYKYDVYFDNFDNLLEFITK